ncbi:hypothetical protein HPB52_011451 [Rhipicephalus sanguineus]|uniref:Uncharacterized protein n=1 Tax=Rhipicephalus sanguineus TaxID=34632 RepID=A0A9D4PBF8_RHISA|nr:hypothetical protein HPB52_011451 [Rhipicephalus sanguineus]
MAAAPTGGYASPPQFDETSDKWPAYQVRLEAFFEGNGITEDKKRALLVTALSTHTVDVLSGRCAPDKDVGATVLRMREAPRTCVPGSLGPCVRAAINNAATTGLLVEVN